MLPSTLLPILFGFAVGYSLDKRQAVDANSYLEGHPWIPAALIANSSRSPCPMLNTLANHGFLHRDGHNITKDDLNRAQFEVLNMTPELSNHTTDAMVAKLGSPKNTSASFSLADFAAHDFTEHDASLTRQDAIQGNVVDVIPSLVVLLMNDSVNGWIDTDTIGKSRARREAESRAIGSLPLPERFTSFAQLEASFIPLVFGVGGDVSAPSSRYAPADQLKTWLYEERLPIELGYVRSPVPLTGDLQASLITGIRDAHAQYVSQYP